MKRQSTHTASIIRRIHEEKQQRKKRAEECKAMEQHEAVLKKLGFKTTNGKEIK